MDEPAKTQFHPCKSAFSMDETTLPVARHGAGAEKCPGPTPLALSGNVLTTLGPHAERHPGKGGVLLACGPSRA